MSNKPFYKKAKKPSKFLMLFILIISMVVVIAIAFGSGVKNKESLIVLVVPVVLVLLNWYAYQGKMKEYNEFCDKINNIKENGVKVSAEVYDFEIKKHTVRRRKGRKSHHTHYYAMISGEYNGEVFDFVTPEINFNYKKLISNKVTVYILDGNYYADDFDL